MKIYVDGSKRSAVARMFPIWEKYGHTVVNDQGMADVQLSVAFIRRNTKLPIVLRIDGVYYDLATNYKGSNSKLSQAHAQAKGIVYQSDLSRRMCEKYLTPRTTKNYTVIHNGIDEWDLFKPHKGINIISCSKWRRHKRLPEIIEVFNIFRKSYPESILHILGPMKKGASIINQKNVIYYDKVEEQKIKEIYKTGDIYLHLSKKDSCPSSVVEAISAGMSVVTTDACGGATEMCAISEGCFIAKGEDLSLNPDYFYKDPYNKLPVKTKDDIIMYMNKIIKEGIRSILPEELSIEHTTKKYIKVMEKLI